MKELRNEIVDRLATLIKEKRKGYEVVFITKYANSYYLYILDNDRPYANVQVFECLYSDNTLELNINKIEFQNCYPTSDRLMELESICEQVGKEINELPSGLMIKRKVLEQYDSIYDYLYETFGYVCNSYDWFVYPDEEIELRNIKWVVKEQLESENK